MAALAERYLTNFHVRMVYRTDRYGRGGDQVPFLEAGFPAVRFTEAHENYTRQHQDLRTENGIHYGDTIDGVDFPYLAQVDAPERADDGRRWPPRRRRRSASRSTARSRPTRR